MIAKRPNFIRTVLSGLIASALVLMSALPCFAAGQNYEAGHSAVVYDIDSGMPFSEANAIEQTPDGFIYIGCYGGLLRFDGRSFERFDGITSVVALFTDSRGRLWISGNGATCMEYGDFRTYTDGDGLPSMSVQDITEDVAGNIWIACSPGLAWLDAGGVMHVVDDDRLNSVSVEKLSAGEEGYVYGCTENGDTFCVSEDGVKVFRSAEELGVKVRCVYAESAADIWFAGYDNTILKGRLTSSAESMTRIEVPQLRSFNRLLRADSYLWLCADNGIGYIQSNGTVNLLEHTTITSSVCDMLRDHEGNLWFASNRQGVLKMASNIFTDISAMSDLGERVVNSIWYADGLFYVGTDSGLVVLDGNYQTVSVPVSELLESSRVRMVTGDSEGRIWFSSFDKNAMVCLLPDGTIKVWNKDNGLASNYARLMMECADGSMLLSETGAVRFFRDGEPAEAFTAEDGLSSTSILSFAQDDDGTIYLGSNGEGIFRIRDGRVELFAGTEELSSGVVLKMIKDPSRGLIWVITSNSINILKNGVLSPADWLPQGHLYNILFSDDGSMWLLGAGGYYAVGSDEVMAQDGASYRFYDASAGVQHMTTPNSSSFVSEDGYAYVACTDGVLGFDVNRMDGGSSDVKLAVPYVDADGVRIYAGADGFVRVPADTVHLDIYGFALSYAFGDRDVSWYLEGFDTEPFVTTKDGLAAASYTNLPGGNYSFRLAALDAESGEETASTVLRIEKEKKIYETSWFPFLCLICFIGLMVFVTMLLLRSQEEKAAKKRERERLNSELDIAAKLQLDVLPSTFPAFPDRGEFDLFASMHPAKEVGGDFYDFFLVDDDHLALVVADVSGKGIPAALFMMISKALVKNTAEMGLSPSRVMEEVNAQLCDNNKNNMFVTVWLGILELSTGRLVFADAGHEKPMLYHDGSWSFVKKHDGVALALMEPWLLELEDDPAFVDEELQLEPGDILFQYTDGVPESTDIHEELFGDDRLLAAMQAAPEQEPRKVLEYLPGVLKEFVGEAPQFDDITMLAIRYNGPENREEAKR